MLANTTLKESWMELTLVRSTVVNNDIQGGMSALFLASLKLFFDKDGHDMALAGISVKLFDGTVARIFMKLAIVISDEAALHSIFACKGSSGLKPCLLCQNVYNFKNVRNIVENDTTGNAQYHTCHDWRKLKLHTPSTIKAIASRLSAAVATMTKTNFTELETRLGWNYIPESLIFSPDARKICDLTSCVVFDWMHVFFVNGIFNSHSGVMMWTFKSYGITYEKLRKYVEEWHWPSYMGKGADDIFCPKRAKSSWDDGNVKATASEGLSVLPVMANFCQSLVDNCCTSAVVRDHARCFVMLADIVRLIQRCSRYQVDPDELQLELCRYLQTFKGLYGEEWMVPKFHFAIHFPDYLRRFGFVPSCFVLERKHKVPKRFANEVRNTDSAWEASVLREVTCHRLAAISSDHFGTAVGLRDAHRCSKKLKATLQQTLPFARDAEREVVYETSQIARINAWEKCSPGDIVMLKMPDGAFGVAEVAVHVAVQAEQQTTWYLSMVRMWKQKSSGARSSKWQRSDDACWVCTEDLQCSVIWAASGSIATVLRPWHIEFE